MIRVIPPELPEYADSPFTESTDIFNLRGYAGELENFISQSPTPMTMVLHGDWGSGKTVFARQFHATLKSNGWRSIYFDCYANDYHDDPLLPLSAAILRETTVQGEDGEEDEKNFRRDVVAAARAVIPVGAKALANWSTAGLVGTGEIEEVEARFRAARNEIGDDADLTDAALLEELDSEIDNDSPSKAFQAGLRRLLQQDNEDEERGNRKPLVLILDELDRCRPDFALKLLERLKHFFAVDGVCFFVITNLEELRGIVSHTYGLSDTARTYLEKFFDVQTTFPEPEQYKSTNPYFRMTRYLYQKLHLPTQNRKRLEETIEIAMDICASNNLALRTFQRVFTHIALYSRAAVGGFSPTPIVAGMAVLKQIDVRTYRSAARGNVTFEAVDKSLGLSKLNVEDDVRDAIVVWWEWATTDYNNMTPERAQYIGQKTSNMTDVNVGQIPREVAQTMDRFTSFDGG